MKVSMKLKWNDTDRRRPKQVCSESGCAGATLSTTITWIFPGYGVDTRSDKPKTVCVSRDTFSEYKNKFKKCLHSLTFLYCLLFYSL